jgi:long-chain acyl-CoA synthetase
VHAAAPCPVPVKRAMIDWWGPILFEFYSMTEGFGAASIFSDEWLRKPGSVGRPAADGRAACCRS